MLPASQSPLSSNDFPPGTDDAPSAQQILLVKLLAEGHTDEFVAHRLGCTRRTLQRRLREVFDILGAISRFQAGVLSERKGWISVEPDSSLESGAHSRQAEEQESQA